MSPKALIPALAAGLLSLSACDVVDAGSGFARYARDFHYTYPLSSRGSLSVETFNGSVEISTWDQDTVDISGDKYGPTQADADDLKVEIDHQASAVSVRVGRPFELGNRGAKFVIKIPRSARVDRITSSNGGIRVTGGDGPARLHTSNGPIRVEGLNGELNAQTSNGGVDLLDIRGEVVAHTSNGPVRVGRLSGSLEATSSNGGIHADIVRADRTVRTETSNGPIELTLPADFRADLHAHTSNNRITLRLPPDINANVSASTSNSSITTEFEVRTQGEFGKHHMNATIGSGGPLFDLSTSNGGIRLLKM